jgi:DNA-directed RNA polymerase specialized sigma24 family protein
MIPKTAVTVVPAMMPSGRLLGMEPAPDRPTSASFPTTCWSRIACAGSATERGARAALEGLCHDYWYPLYAYVRRQGVGPDDACDLVQGFLADLIERRDLIVADPRRGRFRAFLKAACSHYLAHRRDHERALKRGGGRRVIPIDLVNSEGRYGREPSHELTAERLFERQWALSLLETVLARLEAESALSGKAELFTRLRPVLEGNDRVESYREVGESLGMREGAVKVAAHRLRARYRTLLREEVARTVSDPNEVDDELKELLTALAC